MTGVERLRKARRPAFHVLVFCAVVAGTIHFCGHLGGTVAAATSWVEPESEGMRRTVIIRTGCWAGAEEAYYTPSQDEYQGDRRAGLGAVMNFLMRNKLAAGSVRRFELEGLMDPTFDGHLVSIYEALKLRGVDSIIYTNAPGALSAFTDPAAIRRVLPILDRIEADYPRAAPHVNVYRKHLMSSRGYRLAGANQEESEKQLPVADRGPGKSGPESSGGWLSAAAANVAAIRRLMSSALEGGTPRLDLDYIRLIERSQSTYSVPDRCARPLRPMMNRADFWIASGEESVWTSWLSMVAEMAAQRGVRFVFYVPPHLHVRPEEQTRAFKPFFVDRVRRALAPFDNATVIDHSAITSIFNSCDTTFFKRDGKPIVLGYSFNLIGKLKQADLLLIDLSRLNLPGVPLYEKAPKTWWEAQTPRAEWAVRLVEPEVAAWSAEEILSPDVYLRSQKYSPDLPARN